MKLSILVPVYNEGAVVERSLSQVLSAPLPENMTRELIVVDDCSTDGTGLILQRLAQLDRRIVLLHHAVNRGKGAAVRTAIEHATGDFCLVQDADLEYDPCEYAALLQPLLDGRADAVFGSRYMAGHQKRILPFWHTMVNKSLTLLSNMFCNLDLTDMETCYKVFRTDLLKSIPIRSNRFGFEPEIAMKSGKRQLRIYEVPISYHGRTYEEGKKIGWRDGIKVFGVILRYWLIDDLYSETYGRGTLNNISGTPQYVSWLTEIIRPYLRNTVLEVGAGVGSLTGRLMGKRLRYTACEHDPLYLHALRNRFLRTPNVIVRSLDPQRDQDYEQIEECTESLIGLNILEYAEDPAAVIRNFRRILCAGGLLLLLVPHRAALFGSLDSALHHRRRFELPEMSELLRQNGFAIETSHQLNKVGVPAWWFFGKVLGRRQIGKVTLKIFDKTVWLWRNIDAVLPWSGLSLIVVARRAD